MYAMYLRKSRADRDAEARGEGETLARHESILTALAARMDLPVGAVYKEIVSGETIAARPRMQELLLAVMQGTYEGVIVMEVERLARGDTKDQGTVAEAFKFSGTRIITPAKTYDPNNEFDEEYFEFSLFMSRREYKTINRRIQTGRTTAFREGWYIAGTAPYGYEKVKRRGDKGWTLEPIQDQADVVRQIYRLYTDGELQPDGSVIPMGAYQIRDRLNARQIPSRSGGAWSASSIMDIIRNPTYAGYMRWRWRAEKKSIVDGQVSISRRKDENCPKVRGRFEPIITEDLWNRAQDVRTHKRTARPGSANALQNPLSGLVRCAKCGTLMTRQMVYNKTPYPALRCPNNRCDNISSPVYLVEERLLEGLADWLSRYRLEWQPDTYGDAQAALDAINADIRSLRARQEQIAHQITSAYDLLEQGVYDPPTFRERRLLLEKKKAAAGQDLENLQKQAEDIRAREQAIRSYIPRIQTIIDTYNSLESAEERNAILKEIVDHVDYQKTERTEKNQRDSARFTLHIYPRLPEKP